MRAMKNPLSIQCITPLSAIALSVMLVSLPACSRFRQSTPVNQPTPLTQITNAHQVLSPVFNQSNLGNRSTKTGFSLGGVSLSKKQKVALQQQATQFEVASDAQGYVTANANGLITALNANGQKIWQATLAQGLSSGVAIDASSSTVVVSDAYGALIALDRATGKQRWQSRLSSSVMSPVLISGNRVIGLTNSGVVFAHSLQTGEPIWQFATQNPALTVRGASRPILLDSNTVLVASADGRIHAINLENGTPLWSRRMGYAQGASDIERLSDIDATPVLDNNQLYVTSYSGQLVAVDIASGQLAFAKDKDYASIKTLGIDNSQLYVTTLNGKVAALDKLTGNVSWESDALRYRGLSNAMAVGDYVLVGDALGYLHVFAKATGKLIDRASVRHDIAQLQLVGNRVIVSSATGGFSVWQVGR